MHINAFRSRTFYHPSATNGTTGIEPPEDSGKFGDVDGGSSFPIEVMEKHLTPEASKNLQKMAPYSAEALRDVHLASFKEGKFWSNPFNIPGIGTHFSPMEQNLPKLAIIHKLPYLVNEFMQKGNYDAFRANLLFSLSKYPLIRSHSGDDLTDGLSLMVGLKQELKAKPYPNSERIEELLDSIIKLQIGCIAKSEASTTGSVNLKYVQETLLTQVNNTKLPIQVQSNLREVLADFASISSNAVGFISQINSEKERVLEELKPKTSSAENQNQKILEARQAIKKEQAKVYVGISLELAPRTETKLKIWKNPTETILEAAKQKNLVVLGSQSSENSKQTYFKKNGELSNYYAYLLNLLDKFSEDKSFKTWVFKADYLRDILKPLSDILGKLQSNTGLPDSFTDNLEGNLNEKLTEYFQQANTETSFANFLDLSAKFKQESSEDINEALRFLDILKQKALESKVSVRLIKPLDLIQPLDILTESSDENKAIIIDQNTFLKDIYDQNEVLTVSLNPQINEPSGNPDETMIAKVQTDLANTEEFGYGDHYSVASDLNTTTIREVPAIGLLADLFVTTINPEHKDNQLNPGTDESDLLDPKLVLN